MVKPKKKKMRIRVVKKRRGSNNISESGMEESRLINHSSRLNQPNSAIGFLNNSIQRAREESSDQLSNQSQQDNFQSFARGSGLTKKVKYRPESSGMNESVFFENSQARDTWGNPKRVKIGLGRPPLAKPSGTSGQFD